MLDSVTRCGPMARMQTTGSFCQALMTEHGRSLKP